jgi:hypothetical protein
MSDRPEIESHRMELCVTAIKAVISSCWVNCYENFLPSTINVENLTKLANRKWMSDRPEIEPHGMGAVCQISRCCDK